jgi:carbonic anhydrase
MTSSILNKLITGNQAFQKQYFQNSHSIYQAFLESGQCPEVMVIACSDSRVDPALVMNCQPGDLFVVRNVANLVPPCQDDGGYHGTSAALEFAVTDLNVRHIIVFGHSHCGGITALMQSGILGKQRPFISKWMDIAEPASILTQQEKTHQTLDEQVNRCSQHALLHSLKNLQSFPFVNQKVASKQLSLHAWYFDLSDGSIKAHDEEQGHFVPLTIASV